MRTTTIAIIGFVLGIAATQLSRVSADPQPPFDRQLSERLVRAQEAQAQALKELVRVTDRKCR